jgi:protoheme IX farnesyltransferase
LIQQEKISDHFLAQIVQKLKDYQQLMKLNLSLLVVFSSVIGYLIIPEVAFNLMSVVLLFAGGLLVTAAANATNQLLEIEEDQLMKRTADRPLATGRMGRVEAIAFVIITLLLGTVILYTQFTPIAAYLSFASYVLYSFVYTPLKKKTPFSVLVGAIPGSLPCVIGWAAGTGSINMPEAWVLFAFQFFWQFPHFWAIAWLGHDDYKKAGMKMLPQTTKESRYTAFQTVFYSSILIPLAVLPKILGLTSWVGTIVLGIAAISFMWFAIQFFKANNDNKARKLMFASFAYLPLILFTFLIDKFI